MKHLWIEPELSNLKGLIAVIDEHLSGICSRASEHEDADSFGLFDSAEHATGLAFVACQTYMSVVYGTLRIEKHRALDFGPKHRTGLTKVQIINHAANYWKHNNEWDPARTLERQEAKIKQAFESIGFPVSTDYPLSGVLSELTNPFPASFQPVVSVLEAWKVELCKAA